MTRFVLLFLCLLLPQAFADFNSACTAYEAGNYQKAQEEFSALTKQGISTELAYNLGCTETKLENLGQAALWFHRARLLNPQHKEAWQNLRYLTKRNGMAVFDTSTLDLYAKLLKPSTWQLAFWIALWTLILSVSILAFLRPKTIWPWVTLLCLAFVSIGLFATGWIARNLQTKPQDISILIAPTATKATNAPAETADTIIEISPGSQVLHLENRGDWTYVETPGDKQTRGWVRSKLLEPLWPFDPKLVD